MMGSLSTSPSMARVRERSAHPLRLSTPMGFEANGVIASGNRCRVARHPCLRRGFLASYMSPKSRSPGWATATPSVAFVQFYMSGKQR